MFYRKISSFCYLSIPLLVVLIAGCSGNNRQVNDRNERAVSVKGQVVRLTSKELTKSFTGTLEGLRQAVITAKIAEAVEKVLVSEGDRVEADQVLIQLDRTGPTSNFIQAQSLYLNAEKNYKKMKYLYDEGAVSESQFDAAKTEYEVSKANFEASRKMVDLRTPISGTVTSIDVSSGDYLYPGQQVATAAAIDKLRLKLGVSSADIGYFDKGNPVRIFVESYPNLTGQGKVIAVARSADPATRTFQVEIEIDNQSYILKPGMFARCEITVKKFENIIILPSKAVVARDSKNCVFVINGDRVNIREVITGTEFDGFVEVGKGLTPGDTIVTVGQNYLDDGYKVNLVEVTASDEGGSAL